MAFLDRIRSALLASRAGGPVFDPTLFGDPLATRIEWRPLASGGTNFRTHKGGSVSPQRYEFVATSGLLVFAVIFAVIGGVVPLVVFAGIRAQIREPFHYLILLVPATFLFGAWYLGRHLARPVVFDHREGWYWKGRTPPSEDPSVGAGRNACPLSEIKAIQILPENIRSKNANFTSWELNLVLADGTRRNVVDHGSESSLFQDASALAAFLHVPIWNHDDGFRPPSPPTSS